MRLRRGKLCSLPLALLFLTATTSAPPVLHSHAAGATPHTHGGGHTHPHRDGHHPAHAHEHGLAHRHKHPHSTPVQRQEQASHYHLAWLFLDCSFPKSLPGQHDPLEAGLKLSPTVTASSVTLDVRPLTQGGEPLSLLPASPWGTANENELSVTVSDGMRMLPGGLLCDAARRERTGVQLI